MLSHSTTTNLRKTSDRPEAADLNITMSFMSPEKAAKASETCHNEPEALCKKIIDAIIYCIMIFNTTAKQRNAEKTNFDILLNIIKTDSTCRQQLYLLSQHCGTILETEKQQTRRCCFCFSTKKKQATEINKFYQSIATLNTDSLNEKITTTICEILRAINNPTTTRLTMVGPKN